MGMIIGSHSDKHITLSKLSYLEQLKDIKTSKMFLEKLVNKECLHFCYPYGRKNSFNSDTIKVLSKLDFKCGYSIESRKANRDDILKKKYSIPRFDANTFN